MKKGISLICALLLWSPVSNAEWVRVDWHQDAHFFVDPTTLQVNNQMRRIWSLQNYSSSSEGERSAVIFYEYDCANARAKTLAVTGYSGEMQTGNVVGSHTFSEAEWEFYPPNSAGAVVLQYVCALPRNR